MKNLIKIIDIDNKYKQIDGLYNIGIFFYIYNQIADANLNLRYD